MGGGGGGGGGSSAGRFDSMLMQLVYTADEVFGTIGAVGGPVRGAETAAAVQGCGMVAAAVQPNAVAVQILHGYILALRTRTCFPARLL